MLERPVVFSLLGVPVTTTVVITWGIVLVLSALAIVGGRAVRARPAPWQAVVEWAITAVQGMLAEVTGSGDVRYVPLVATIGLFVLVANLISVLPFVEAPTADLNTPIALAAIVFFSVHYFGVRRRGLWGYVRQFARPVFILLPINLLEHFTRTLSLAIRLFGNMLSHQVIVAILVLILPLFVPVLLQLLGLLIGVLQAYIFTILTIVYIGGAVRTEGD
jgi:F-type H+-transporting ATPase subunit a